MNELEGKSMIITGASGGIGRALALELARSGLNLVLNSRNDSLLIEVVEECDQFDADVRYVAGDSSEAEIASELVDTALGAGDFHGFIQAAGVLVPGPLLWELSELQFREIFRASVAVSFQMIRFALPELRKQRQGIAVFLGSGAAERNQPGIGAYCAAKAAEESLARQVAAEAPEVVSFIYRPGVVETQMQQQARQATGGAAEEVRRVFRGYKERGELLSPEKTARALVHILMHNPRRFHGRVATWRDGIA